jgi:hypothetical protein
MTDKTPGGEHTNAPRSGAQKSTVDQLIDDLLTKREIPGFVDPRQREKFPDL